MTGSARELRLGSLRVSAPFGRQAAAGAAILAIFVALCEGLARIPAAGGLLPPPLIGGSHEIPARLAELDTLAAQGPVECLILGNSMVMHDISPEAISEAYRQRTGRDLRCYNAGLSGVNVVGASRMAPILIKRYHPRLIIYGTAFVDYVAGHNDALDLPWVLQQNGQPSLQGWLETSLLSYRIYLAYANPDSLDAYYAYHAALTPSGQLPLHGTEAVTRTPIDRPDLYSDMANFSISDDAKLALLRLEALRADGVALAVVEMPLPEATFDVLPRKQADHDDFVRWLTGQAGSAGVPFFPAADPTLIPMDRWHSYTYLDEKGGAIFSAWLGAQLGAVYP